MNELEQSLNQVLSNPQLMQQIMALAQSMNPPAPKPPPEGRQEQSPPLPDAALMQKVAAMAAGTGVDQNQRALLRALNPYLSRDRVGRLEKAMRAAKLAVFASSLLQNQKGRSVHV